MLLCRRLACFGVRSLGFAFESGGKPPHSKKNKKRLTKGISIMLQILSISLFEKTPILQDLNDFACSEKYAN
jgi:hypothetical protein